MADTYYQWITYFPVRSVIEERESSSTIAVSANELSINAVIGMGTMIQELRNGLEIICYKSARAVDRGRKTDL